MEILTELNFYEEIALYELSLNRVGSTNTSVKQTWNNTKFYLYKNVILPLCYIKKNQEWTILLKFKLSYLCFSPLEARHSAHYGAGEALQGVRAHLKHITTMFLF